MRTVARVGAMVAVVALAIGLYHSDPRPAAAQSGCPAGQCVYLPLVHKFIPVHPVVLGRSFEKLGPGVSGEVVNNSRSTVYNVTLLTRCYDPAGNLLSTGRGGTLFGATFPNDTTPFIANSGACTPRTPEYTLVVEISDFEMTSPVVYKPLTVRSTRPLGASSAMA